MLVECWDTDFDSKISVLVPSDRRYRVRMAMGYARWWNHSARVVVNHLSVASDSHQVGRVNRGTTDLVCMDVGSGR